MLRERRRNKHRGRQSTSDAVAMGCVNPVSALGTVDPSSALNCCMAVAADEPSWETGETQRGQLKGPRLSLGKLFLHFAGRETVGIKKKNEQRTWAGPLVFFLAPEQICVASAFP